MTAESAASVSGRARWIAIIATVATAVALVAGAVLVSSSRPGGLTLGDASPTAGSSSPATSPVPTEMASLEASAVPSAAPSATLPASFPPLAAGVVPILYLHRVVAPPPAWNTWTAAQRRQFLAYDVIPAAFAADLDWLKANGYTTILPRDLAAHWDHGTPLPPRPVMITIDDGHQSWNRTILPMLQERGMVAEFYLTLDAIAAGSISWTQVRELAAAGMGIGAHDVHHFPLVGPGSPPLTLEQIYAEVHRARVVIGEHIGTEPDSMAYVGGAFDDEVIAGVKRAGYTTARSIIRGIRQPVGDRFELRVVAIAPHDDVVDPYTGELVPGLPTFVAKITGAKA